jgi:hypothetical protein
LWLNDQPVVKDLLQQQWQGRPITPQNLSDYRASAEYTKWLKSQEALETSQEKTKFVLGFAADAGEHCQTDPHQDRGLCAGSRHAGQ